MSGTTSACRTYIVTVCMGAVEALKDHGFARWNYPLRTLHHRLKSLSSRPSSSVAAVAAASELRRQAVVKTDKSIKRVMELDCWGPSVLK